LLDLTPAMLKLARCKTGFPCVCGTATALPFRHGAFDFIFASYVLQHVANLRALFEECARVLSHGAVAIATLSHEYIEQYPMNRYFPSLRKIDLGRFPHPDYVLNELKTSDFSIRHAGELEFPPIPLDTTYVEKIAHRFISTYHLVPAVEFEVGVQQLRREIEQNAAPWKFIVRRVYVIVAER
jgi:SAM-dependent methyltransferase